MPRVKQAPECVIEGCEKPQHGRGYCGMHHYRWRTHGDPLVKDDRTGPRKGSDIGYRAAHLRVRTARGSASAHTCECGAAAQHWCYDHGDPQEKRDERGRPFSVDPAHYRPMCVPCHKRTDLARLKETA